MSRTKALARKLGLLKRSGLRTEGARDKKAKSSQVFTHVLVIDFEATCWQEKKSTQEIIEFPAVLMEVTSGEVVGEFHQYVQPQENTQLSSFCKELTGITQDQVDGGLPLPTCLMIFNKWVKELREASSITLVEPGHQYSEDDKLCAIATWTDWDLGVCLKYECSRKHIRRPSYFDHWINLKMLYKSWQKLFRIGPVRGWKLTARGYGEALHFMRELRMALLEHWKILGSSLVEDNTVVGHDVTLEHWPSCAIRTLARGVVRPPATMCANADPASCGDGPVGCHGIMIHHGNGGHHDEGRLKDGPDLVHLSDILDSRKHASGMDLEACPRTCPISEQQTKQDGGHLYIPQPSPSPPGEPKRQCGAWREGACASAEDEVLDERERELDELFGSVTGELDLHLDGSITRHLDGSNGVTADLGTGHVASIAPVGGKNCCGKSEPKSDAISMTTSIKLQSPSCVLGAKNKQNCNQTRGVAHGDLLKELFSPPTISVTPQRLVSSVRLQISSLDTPHHCTSSSTITPTNVSVPQGTVTPPIGGRGVETKSLIWTTPSSTSSSSAWGCVSRGGNPTPPLCKCGRRAKRQTVSSPGPNDGRHFFACPLGKNCSSKRGCGFFVWVDSCSTRVVTSPDLLGSEYDDA
eukprot:Em0016g576a